MRLGLGTVQFGMPYGVSNNTGQPSLEEVRSILQVAASEGIKVLDTAASYGSSEEALGDAIVPGQSFSIVTKTPKFEAGLAPAGKAHLLTTTFHQSLLKLKRERVYGLLAHDPNDLINDDAPSVFAEMQKLKQAGLVSKLGVTVYTASQIDAVVERFAIDLVQVPVNVLDQRLIKSGHIAALKSAGIEVHARSLFLQGLLLIPPDDAPEYFSPITPRLTEFHQAARDQGLSAIHAALGFVLQNTQVDACIVGVNSAAELREIIAASKCVPGGAADFSSLACDDERFVNPARWVMHPQGQK